MKNNSSLIIVKKIAIYFFILLIIISLVFFAINILIEPQIKKNIAVSSQIESNLWKRYLYFLGNLFSFQTGRIFSSELNNVNLSIFGLYLSQFKWTILFTILSFSIGFILGNVLGIWSAYKYNKSTDFIINLTVAAISTIPLIVLAIVALGTSTFLGYPSQFISNSKYLLISLLVPAIISAFGSISLFHARSRKITKNVMQSNYFEFAISLGNSRWKLFKSQIFKNLVIGELQAIVPFYLLLFSSSLVIERIFSIPGQSVFISYAFSKGEVNLIMFYFTFSFFTLIIFKWINQVILNILNPLQNIERRIKWFNRKWVKKHAIK
ncbi:peptide ABC transporter permease [[Mycoplasma] phocae]|uniref:Peptide ABC transporter permease n=1 Tax=[Mycoplasma] phocae TaxID=142651 RepID=A0A2Z5IQ45_9BACT|nr:ABC transporter permease subunit [[Mycoplasma] phocae]AXE60750.1 peptide ABC transporter permease [[Mycoplasma] phocae]